MTVEVHEDARLVRRLNALCKCVAWIGAIAKDIHKVLLSQIFTLEIHLDVLALPVAFFIIVDEAAREGCFRTAPMVRWQHEQDLIIRDAFIA